MEDCFINLTALISHHLNNNVHVYGFVISDYLHVKTNMFDGFRDFRNGTPQETESETTMNTDVEMVLEDQDAIDQQTFHHAADYVQTWAVQGVFDTNVLLQLYALYKQAVDGPCRNSRPFFWERQSLAKW